MKIGKCFRVKKKEMYHFEVNFRWFRSVVSWVLYVSTWLLLQNDGVRIGSVKKKRSLFLQEQCRHRSSRRSHTSHRGRSAVTSCSWSRGDVANQSRTPSAGTTGGRSCLVVDNGMVEESYMYYGTGGLVRRRQWCGYSQQCSRKQEQCNGGCGPQANGMQRQYLSEERTPNRKTAGLSDEQTVYEVGLNFIKGLGISKHWYQQNERKIVSSFEHFDGVGAWRRCQRLCVIN